MLLRPDRRVVLLACCAFAIGLAGALAGCAAFAPRSVEISKARLQERLAQRFPIVRRVAEGIDLTVEAPRLELQPDLNRFALECNVAAGERLLGRPLFGQLALSSGLLFDEASQSVRATEVRVERFHVDGLPAAFERTLERVVRPLAAAWLEQQPIWQLQGRDLERLQAAGVRPGAIRIGSSAVSIELVPR